MNPESPIVVIDDDADDYEILKGAIWHINIQNDVVWLQATEYVIEYLLKMPVQPFIIFCDINMPKMNGLALKQQIDDNTILRRKSIPFIFYSTRSDKDFVDKAYKELNIQGFFRKGTEIQDIYRTLKLIIEYWDTCIHPNSIK